MNIVSIFWKCFHCNSLPPVWFDGDFTQCSPKASRYDHIFRVATPANIDYCSSLGVLLEYVIIFAGEKSGLSSKRWALIAVISVSK